MVVSVELRLDSNEPEKDTNCRRPEKPNGPEAGTSRLSKNEGDFRHLTIAKVSWLEIRVNGDHFPRTGFFCLRP